MRLRMIVEDIYPVSTNDMYIATRGKGQYGAFLRKSDTLKKFQSELWSRIVEKYSNDFDRFIKASKELYRYLGFKVHIWVGMNDMFYKSKPDDLRPYDASNYIKAIEDIVANGFEHDDKYNMEVTSTKFDIENEAWVLIIEYEPCNYMEYDVSYDYPKEDGLLFDNLYESCKFSSKDYI